MHYGPGIGYAPVSPNGDLQTLKDDIDSDISSIEYKTSNYDHHR